MSPDKQDPQPDAAPVEETPAAPSPTEAAPAATAPAPESPADLTPEEALTAATEEPEVELPASEIHPSAPAGSLKADLPKDAEEYFIGMWGDKKNYGCPYCTFASISGPGEVDLHVMGMIDSGDVKHTEALRLAQSQGE